jgi:L-alanine-DL-glutamate epimerase-like enolase superfamily enzyme
LQAVRAALRPGDELQIDANGGWDLAGARQMIPWLAEQGVVLVEQPLAPLLDAEADTAGFAALQGLAPIPVVADESCWDLGDLLRLAPHVQGINIKLVKCGGLSEGLLMARTARRLGLGVMLGCYSDGGLLNSGAAQLLPLVQWPDLDSHLNLIDDPFAGPDRDGDVLRPVARPGLGAQLLQEVA